MDDEPHVVTTAALDEAGARTSCATSLPPHPSSIGAARRFVRTALVAAGRTELLDDAELAVSEIVTNAVVHAGTRIQVEVVLGPVLLRVEVQDSSPHQPRARRYAATASTGRGLGLLNEVAADWGVRATEDGKAVWFELAPSLAPPRHGNGVPAAESSPSSGQATGSASTRVELLGAPVLLYDAWRQHAEALLREYLLATLDDGDPEDAIRVHAEASDALALLDEAFPVAPPTDSPAAALAAAVSPAASPPPIHVVVPDASRRNFITLDRILEDALARADAGTFLTPAVQPELRELRRWLCDQVVSQCLGADAAPWNPRDALLAVSAESVIRHQSGWDAVTVSSSERALIAVDDTGLVIAVSRVAEALLGYDDPTDPLPGRRLVSLIPQRFRQAHLAGFTVHLLTGSGTLLDTPVTVPVLRSDRTELSVRLTVHEDHLADGRPVFIAELEPRTTSVAE
jgi:anti-sigma regulatory factor (Ser/Thr protein kinase)